MYLEAKPLIEKQTASLLSRRQKESRQPGLALIWVGDDPATAAFIRAKERMAKKLDCQFFLHHFERAATRQLSALIAGLNQRADVDGIVLQLPLPAEVDRLALINAIRPQKDVDNLRGDAPYAAPTPTGITSLLTANGVNPAKEKTVIIGDGWLVGRPLADIFRANGWPFEQITANAQKHAERIRQSTLLIAATGQAGLVQPSMVHPDMTVVDGSGVDVVAEEIEPLVKAVTPAKGAVGPLTVCQLFANLLEAASQQC